jgi:hypothetical protein
MNIPLTPGHKHYVLAELEKCKRQSDTFWQPDNQVLQYIDRINSVQGCVTLTSKYGARPLDGEVVSYLSVAVDEKINRRVDLKTAQIAEEIMKLDQNCCMFRHWFQSGENPDTPEFRGDLGLAITDNAEKYTAVDRRWYFLHTPAGKAKQHKLFWRGLIKLYTITR